MKRRSFIKGAGIGLAAVASPAIVSAVSRKESDVFVHNPEDYAFVPEEDYEFQEYEVDVPEDWVEEDIVWA